MKMCYAVPALFVEGAAVHPADLPIRSTHLLINPADFPITPTQPHMLLTVIRPMHSLRLTDVDIMCNCGGYCS